MFKIGDKIRVKSTITNSDLKKMGYSDKKTIDWILNAKSMNIERIDKPFSYENQTGNRIFYFHEERRLNCWLWEDFVELIEKRRGHLLTKVFV